MFDHSTSLVTRLRAWGLNGFAAALLEIAGPLALVGAQTLYAAEPLLTPWVSETEVARWAGWLEDPRALAQLATQLNRETDA